MTDGSDGPSPRLLLAALCGVAFGFLLQKGGVAKHHVLVGSLLLQDFTVFKVMLAAIVTGMVGVLVLHRAGVIELHVKATRWLANVAGGLVFGVGFAVSGYCPGTQAAAIGQGNYDALFGAAGMIAGSWVYAEASDRLSSVEKIGDRGELTLPGAVGASRTVFVAIAAPVLVGALILLEVVTVR